MNATSVADTGRLIEFAAGGTGGHLQPARVLRDELARRHPTWRMRWVLAGRDVEEAFVPGEDERVALFPGRPSRPSMARGDLWWRAAQRVRSQSPPDLVVMTGGYVALTVAAARPRTPWILLEPDRRPGRAARCIAPRARSVFRQWSAESARGRGEVTGMPLRLSTQSREEARASFGVDDDDRPLLVVTGGSQGARGIDRRMALGAAALRSVAGLRLVHVCGASMRSEVEAAYARAELDAQVLTFCHRLPDLYRAADLVVSRAGGMTVAELAALGVASVLVPYPHHPDRHQEINAQVLVDAGAGWLALESDGSERDFLHTHVVPRLLHRETLVEAGRRARALGTTNGAVRIADEVERWLGVGLNVGARNEESHCATA